MIKKLRKKLTIMFLFFTMLIFTAVLLIMLSNTAVKEQDLEIQYINNMADSIIDEVRNGKKLDELDLSVYVTKFRIWVCLSDGITKKSTPECFDTPSDILINQIKPRKSFESTQSIRLTDHYNLKSSRTIYLISGTKNKKYYKIHNTFSSNGTEYDLIMIYPQSTIWKIMCSDCSWYPLLWVGIFLLMYLVSRVLIRKAIKPVEAAMKSQKEFIASASHELKAPLSVIQINSETLDIDKSDIASQQKQKVILDECGLMSKLIQSMLALASSDAGNWKMNMRETDINTLLIEVWEMFGESARKKNIRLDLDIEERYPKIVCDKERITQVLGILLDNAITYSMPDLSIEMGARIQSKQIVFYVTDHGPGISDKEKEKVFERFYSGDPSRTDKSHYGLGLCIAKKIVRFHQGTILVKDTPNGGCTFEIRIPLEQGSD
nr:HAMP domain-containing sensor histidine kinase [uncultured Caproiciproducens sp.]